MRNYENINYFVEKLKSGEIRYNDGNLYRGEKLIKGSKSGKGQYLAIHGKQNYQKRKAFTHLIIFAYFHGVEELQKHETIDHIDGDKYNNRVENLQGLSLFENSQKNSGGKLSQDDAREIKKLLTEGYGCNELGRRYGVSGTTISKIKTGKRFRYI